MPKRTNNRTQTPEGAVLASVLEVLALYRIWHERRNTRVLDVVGKGGKTRPMQFGKAGTGDVFCTPRIADQETPMLLWIEVKGPDGRRSKAQKDFQVEVEEAGHTYLVVRSIDELLKCFKDWDVERQ